MTMLATGSSLEKPRKLPDGWRWTRLDEVGTFVSGGTPSKANEAYWGGTIPFVTGADITELRISSRHARSFLTEVGMASGKTAICPAGTVMFVTRTRVGRLGVATETMGASQDISPLICGPELLPEYACRYLLSISDHLITHSRGSTISGLTRDFARSLEIPLAPLSEQKRIAAILNEQMAAVDRARAAAKRRLEAAKALPAAYLRAAFDSPEAQKWPKKRLGDIAMIVQNGIYKSAEFYGRGCPFLRMYNISKDSWNLTLDQLANVLLSEDEIERFRLEIGDLLVSRVNSFELVGECAWVQPAVDP